MKSILLFSSIRLRFAMLGMVLVGASAGLAATPAANETGARLLRAQLPNANSLAQVPCESLARAVGRATMVHRPEASAILSAALTRRDKFSCACVTRIFRVSIAAAPAQSSALLETASALYPDCADALLAALHASGDKNTVDDKNGPEGASRNDSFDPNVRGLGEGGPSDLTDRDIAGLGFGGGFGPDFPGAPGFTGSVPSGGIALPPVAVTSVVNG